MKVLKVSEIHKEIDRSIQKKKEEKKILAIRKALNKVIDLGDSLKGEGGEAIKQHFTVLHIPVLLQLEAFLDHYLR